ncbi:metallophosphoesterase [Aliikangiella maris]|uniref:Metallophosphoesterase n=2 Tax=Aliikangiella maris TaxID=3162458 RepID=A0ABV2BUW7_9GAMM
MLFKSYLKNTNGRDFICADIHGHFSLLESQLKGIGFDVATDRLFCLGDLIDRGLESRLALDYLAKPWFYSVQGNHERMLMNVYQDPSSSLSTQWYYWGGDWAKHFSQSQLGTYASVFNQLPVAIELELANGQKVGLVHAELPDICDWNIVRQKLRTLPSHHAETDHMVSDMLWLKQQAYYFGENLSLVKSVKNIDHVFHGHTIMPEYLQIANRTFMDLGPYKTGRIGLIEPLEYLQQIS